MPRKKLWPALLPLALVTTTIAAGCGGGSNEAAAEFCKVYVSACDGDKPRFSLRVVRTFVRGNEGCYATDFGMSFPQRGGRQIILCGAGWTTDAQGFSNPGQIRCYAGSERLDDGKGNWPTACDAANVGLVGADPPLWQTPPAGVPAKQVAGIKDDDELMKKVAEREAQIFPNYTPAEKDGYRRGYEDCQALIAKYDYTAVGNYAASHNRSNDPAESAKAQGCSDANSETPLPGSGFTVPAP